MKPQHINGYICSECGQVGPGTIRNEGIGPYEYWGAKCNDVSWVFLSVCCDAPMVNGLGIQQCPETVSPDFCDEP